MNMFLILISQFHGIANHDNAMAKTVIQTILIRVGAIGRSAGYHSRDVDF
jgi:hypothetical protein